MGALQRSINRLSEHVATKVQPLEHSVTALQLQATTLAEQVEILKRERNLRGNMKEVVYAAAEQLGIDPSDKPLIQVAQSCLHAMGYVA